MNGPSGGSGTGDLHDLLVPVGARYLRQLAIMLDRLGAHAAELGLAEQEVLDARLRPDMPTLRMQTRIAMEFPFRALDQLLDAASARAAVDTATLAGLRQSIEERIQALGEIASSELRDGAGRVLRDRAGEAEVEMSAPAFVSLYVLPNFFFHATVVYITCRLLGVPLGKGDYDGFHVYPAGIRID